MARASGRRRPSITASVLQLHDVVWLQPIAVAQDKQVNIALLPRDPAGQPHQRIDFEVYTQDDHIHCQGGCSFSSEVAAPDRLDVAQLKTSMRRHGWSAEEIYAAFATMGLHYGPGHRSIAALECGDRQLLAHLVLPHALAADQHDYVLHPSLMDGALQAATVLLFDPHRVPGQPIVPFALETLRLVAPCKPQMLVWARFSHGSHPHDKSARLDIDMLDTDGHVCVQMRGFTPRSLGKETLGSLLATQEWRASHPVAEPAAQSEQHVIVCDLPQVEAQKIARDVSLVQLDPARAPRAYGKLALACFEKAQALPQPQAARPHAAPGGAAGHRGPCGACRPVRLVQDGAAREPAGRGTGRVRRRGDRDRGAGGTAACRTRPHARHAGPVRPGHQARRDLALPAGGRRGRSRRPAPSRTGGST
jgi:hypothetical protein